MICDRPQLWKLNDFRGAQTYTLTVDGAQVSFDVAKDGTFEISPEEARKAPLHAIAKRIK